MAHDALGNELVIGRRYGFSRNSNGWTTTTVGMLTKVDGKWATLSDCVRRSSVYGGATKAMGWNTAKPARTYCVGLFPVGDG